MAWLRGKVALDIAGAVNKISESVKNIEKNFDNALGFQDQPSPGASTSTVAQKHDASSKQPKDGADADDSTNSSEERASLQTLNPEELQTDGIVGLQEEKENLAEKSVETNVTTSDEETAVADNHIEVEVNSQTKPGADDAEESEHKENSKVGSITKILSIEDEVVNLVDQVATTSPELVSCDGPYAIESVKEGQPHLLPSSNDASEMVPDAKVNIMNQFSGDEQRDEKEHNTSSERKLSDNADSTVELEALKMDVMKMETALLGAARQAQAKADEIEKLMNENEQLKSITADQKRKSNADIESLHEEYHQRVSALERKVYALMRERDTLRREQNKRSDSTTLLKEKDEIITQVMAEGEELSKKQAVQESTIRKLRAQIREFEDEKKGLISKLQNEENKVESSKKDKVATEKALKETIDKNKAELAAQKEHFMNALNVAKEAKSLAEARANNEARNELESRLRETEEREAMLVQTLKELRQTLSRTEQQAVYKEDMLRKDIDDLQKRYQASERRCEELVMEVPESTRPLLRQIETTQEATARKAEAWAAVERSLNIQLQDAEAKAAAAEEKYRSVNEHLSRTLSRINVLEAQISCLRAEQTQVSRSLEKERQRASESRQDYLALKEEADTHKAHVNQVEKEMKELKRKHILEMQEAFTQHNLLQQDIEREKVARMELEKTTRLQPGKNSTSRAKSVSANGLTRRLSSASNLSSMEESFFPRAYIDSSHNFSERSPREPNISPLYLKSMTPNAFQAALRQKEGELASYVSRIASMETIRDSLSEELVKMTKECKRLRSEAALLPSIKAELEALRFRHSAALELMGERDEELEELRADIVDLKEMYREQVNMLVNKIQKGSSVYVS